MSHFAELDDNNVVLRVIVIDPDEVAKRSGRWVRTYYDAAQRDDPSAFAFNFAGVGHTYDVGRRAFVLPQPYPSWVFDETTCRWMPPSPLPDSPNDERWRWSEELRAWVSK